MLLSMGKGFRLRLWRAFPGFKSCRSKDAAASSPVYRLSRVGSDGFDVELQLADHHRHRHPPLISSRCCRPWRFRSPLASAARKGAEADDLPLARETPGYLWREEERWHVVATTGGGGDVPSSPRRKIDSDDGGAFLRKANRRRGAGLRRRRRREATRRRWGNNSSADEDSGWFSSDEENEERLSECFGRCYGDGSEKEEETLISSTDVDSCDNLVWRRRAKRSWAAEAAVAVVKRSEDPREDFRQSMAEMVVEKKIFDAAGLEQLLRCFLSLNSSHHHAAIIAAFEDIWAALFSAAGVGAHG